MTMERLEALKRVAGNEDPTRQSAIQQMKVLFTSAGLEDLGVGTVLPEPPRIYSEISLKTLEAEMERQAKIYLELEFHRHEAIGVSREKFKDMIMKLIIPHPENFKGRLDTPVIIFGQIPPEDQCRLAGIDYFLEGSNRRDWPDDPMGYKTPNTSYLTWTDEGARFMYRKVQDVRQELLPDERGGTEFDGIGLYIAKPQVLITRFLDLPGTTVESGGAACLHLWDGQPELSSHWVDDASPRFGSLVCGRQK